MNNYGRHKFMNDIISLIFLKFLSMFCFRLRTQPLKSQNRKSEIGIVLLPLPICVSFFNSHIPWKMRLREIKMFCTSGSQLKFLSQYFLDRIACNLLILRTDLHATFMRKSTKKNGFYYYLFILVVLQNSRIIFEK